MYKLLTIALAALVLANAGPAFAKKAKPSPAPGGAMPTCASGDPVVWENLSGSKVYHPQGDQYFGKTKKGAYACKSAADSAGFHASGSGSSMKSSPKKPATPEPGGMGASPNAGSVPTPVST